MPPPFGAETDNPYAAPLAPVADARVGVRLALASRARRLGASLLDFLLMVGGPVLALLLLNRIVPLLGLIVAPVDVLFIFRNDHRCLHDLIADTKVVKI
jgi:uncharacterized RDD family membrane protein YckC